MCPNIWDCIVYNTQEDVLINTTKVFGSKMTKEILRNKVKKFLHSNKFLKCAKLLKTCFYVFLRTYVVLKKKMSGLS